MEISNLANPMAQIFKDREEAEWGYNLILQTANALGVTTSSDERITLRIRRNKKVLRFNFCSWLILEFCRYSPDSLEVCIPLLQSYASDRSEFIKYTIANKENEPIINSYAFSADLLKPMDQFLSTSYFNTLGYIKNKFMNYRATPYLKSSDVTLVDALFNGESRKELFEFGHSVDEEIELQPEYTLEQVSTDTGIDFLELERWLRSLKRKGQAIIFGPPGTGKTFVAEKLAKHLIALSDGFFDLVQFHPAYSYEDFVQGIRPKTRDDGSLEYTMVLGRFLEFCKEAQSRKGKCVLIIDEINRANLARVFGELMYLLEYRDKEIFLAGGGSFSVPENVLIIGTMNTADRSIALVDYALRRRFSFIHLKPNYDTLIKFHEATSINIHKLIKVLKSINKEINDPNYELGISYFLTKELDLLIEDIWVTEIEPYLEEYFFDQPDTVKSFRWAKVKEQL